MVQAGSRRFLGPATRATLCSSGLRPPRQVPLSRLLARSPKKCFPAFRGPVMVRRRGRSQCRSLQISGEALIGVPTEAAKDVVGAVGSDRPDATFGEEMSSRPRSFRPASPDPEDSLSRGRVRKGPSGGRPSVGPLRRSHSVPRGIGVPPGAVRSARPPRDPLARRLVPDPRPSFEVRIGARRSAGVGIGPDRCGTRASRARAAANLRPVRMKIAASSCTPRPTGWWCRFLLVLPAVAVAAPTIRSPTEKQSDP